MPDAAGEASLTVAKAASTAHPPDRRCCRSSAIGEIAGGCLAARVRVIARTVTAVYAEAIGGRGITSAQVHLLAAPGVAGPCSPARPGEVLELERSTVSRNLDSSRETCRAVRDASKS